MSSRRHDVRGAVARFEPRNPSQALARRLYQSCPVLFLLGPAGTGKTTAAVGLAASDVLADSPYRELVVVRPAAQADRSLGFLPGTLDEKLQPYKAPVLQALARVSFNFPADRLRFEALGYSRGVTWDGCVVLVEEAQNATLAQLTLVLTRLGQNARVIVSGDPDQADVPPTGDYVCDLEECVDRLEGLAGVGVVDFPAGQSLRHPLVGQIAARLRR